eukprot:scaffold216226_cov30-Tisochrysis_lutea.AAC.1
MRAMRFRACGESDAPTDASFALGDVRGDAAIVSSLTQCVGGGVVGLRAAASSEACPITWPCVGAASTSTKAGAKSNLAYGAMGSSLTSELTGRASPLASPSLT